MLHAEDGRQGAVWKRQGRVKSDSSYYHQPSSTDKVKFFVLFVWKMCRKWNPSVMQENVMKCNDGSESKENVKSKKVTQRTREML